MLKKTARFFKDKIQLTKRIRDRLRYLGFYNGEKAFVGPSIIQVDLTNDCNNDCIACWCNSPLLEEKRLTGARKSAHLSLVTVKQLLDDAVRLGTQEIFLSGGGEPFMHPHIMEIIAYIKSKGLTLHINTNFTLLDETKIKALVDHKVDSITVSLWAGSPAVYSATHPNKDERDFERIERLLKYVQSLRTPNAPPHVKLYQVISNINYRDLAMMYDIAVRTESELVEFALIDPIPGKTDVLMLNQTQRNEVLVAARALEATLSDAERQGIPMPIIVQFDQFMRRLSDDHSESGDYDKSIIDSFPCYAGWVFSRILPEGNVNACLKAHRIPIGNINTDRFMDIWNSQRMNIFRKKTAVCKKDTPFFAQIGNDLSASCGCHKGCDDLGRNLLFHKGIKSLTILERFIWKTIGRASR